MSASIRIAGPADLAQLRALVERAYRGDSAKQGWTHEADLLFDERTSDAELAANLTDPATRVLVMERQGALAATVTIQRVSEGTAYLGMFAVDPALQAGGIGRAMIAAAEAEAVRSFGATAMEMTVIARREELVAWYERRGYARTGETRLFPPDMPQAADLPMAVLEKRL